MAENPSHSLCLIFKLKRCARDPLLPFPSTALSFAGLRHGSWAHCCVATALSPKGASLHARSSSSGSVATALSPAFLAIKASDQNPWDRGEHRPRSLSLATALGRTLGAVAKTTKVLSPSLFLMRFSFSLGVHEREPRGVVEA